MGEGRYYSAKQRFAAKHEVGVAKRLAGKAGGNISFLPRYIHKLSG